MGHSDDFEFSIQNNDGIEIKGNYGGENFQRISFEIFLMESRIWNPASDNLTDATVESGKPGVILVLHGGDKGGADVWSKVLGVVRRDDKDG